jgi:hypothetical protein
MKYLCGQAIAYFTENKVKFFMGRTHNYIALLQSVRIKDTKLIVMPG